MQAAGQAGEAFTDDTRNWGYPASELVSIPLEIGRYPCTYGDSDGAARCARLHLQGMRFGGARPRIGLPWLPRCPKLHPVEELREAYDLGQRHFGESRLQEAIPKIEALPVDIVWHFIGPLQSNKARRVASLFDVIHSFCKTSQIVEADKAGTPVQGLIEVNIAEEAQKTGISPQNLDGFRADILQSSNVHFRGLMTIGPVVPDAELMRPYFRELRQQATRLGVDWLSMGMSNDFEVAIQEGASHIRVGSAIFGSRKN